jgi:Tol biopolymer transport system component
MRKPLLFLGLLATSLPVLAADPRPFNARDLVTVRRLTDPQPSPKGDRVAFVLRATDLEANRGRLDLWMVNADGSGLVQLTQDPGTDANPRWWARAARASRCRSPACRSTWRT